MSSRSQRSGRGTERVNTGRTNISNLEKTYTNSGRLAPASNSARIKPETPLSHRVFQAENTPLSQRRKQGGYEKRKWVENERRAETPPKVPDRIGSITSGGVDGFGYLRHDTKVNPVKIENMAGKYAIFDPDHRLLSPGGPWWERERFKTKFFPHSSRNQSSRRPPSPLPYGSAMNVEVLRDDGRLTETEEFLKTREDLKGASERQIQREMFAEMVKTQDRAEIPREIGLGSDFFKKSTNEAVEMLMHKLDSEYRGDFSLMHQHLLQDEYTTKVRSSALMHKTIHPREMYGPPPHHPDAVDGYQTHRMKHENTMNRLYGHNTERTHSLPDRPENWNRRDGVKAGIPGIQSFTYFAHQLQNAGYGAP